MKNSKSGITVVCKKCSRNNFYKVGKDNKCMYCGTEIALDESIDSSDLFIFDYQQYAMLESKLCDYKPSDRPSLTHFMQTFHRDGFLRVNQGRLSESTKMAMNMDLGKKSDDMNYLIGEKKARDIQIMINAFLFALKCIWLSLTDNSDEKNTELSKCYYELYQSKKAQEDLSPVSCPHCSARNAPSNLLLLTCTNCKKTFNFPLAPGFKTAYFDASRDKYIVQERLLEKIYTLLEAIIVQSQKICPAITIPTISSRAIDIFQEHKSLEDGRVCPICSRKAIALHLSNCVYCNASLKSNTPGFFFDP